MGDLAARVSKVADELAKLSPSPDSQVKELRAIGAELKKAKAPAVNGWGTPPAAATKE